jgi:hypothetical protein
MRQDLDVRSPDRASAAIKNGKLSDGYIVQRSSAKKGAIIGARRRRSGGGGRRIGDGTSVALLAAAPMTQEVTASTSCLNGLRKRHRASRIWKECVLKFVGQASVRKSARSCREGTCQVSKRCQASSWRRSVILNR